ncbi:MAG: SurA N-terminal domain-containing protein, partial [Myxococcota bacterium]
MSILERMRGSTDSTPMQIVLIAIVIAFVGWYALPQGEKVQVAVEVDGERVLVQEFGLRFGQAQRMVGRKLSEEDERELEATVKAQIARELVLTQESVRRGYYVSPEEIGRSIKDTPAFHDRNGKFNKEQYDDAVKGSGRTRADFETDFRDQLLRDKLHSAVALGVFVDDAAVERQYDLENASIDLEMITIT